MTSSNTSSQFSGAALQSHGVRPTAGMWFVLTDELYSGSERSEIAGGRLKPCDNSDAVGTHNQKTGRGSP